MNLHAQPQTLAQKLVARASGHVRPTPGEIVTCKVDLAMFHDSGGPRRLQPMLAELGAPIWNPIKDTDLQYAVNTNWDLFRVGSTMYLRDDTFWLKADTLDGRIRRKQFVTSRGDRRRCHHWAGPPSACWAQP